MFSTEAYTFGRTKLSLGQTNITYTHDGYETDIAELTPLSQLKNSTFVIKKAKNIRALDNRLVLSNVNISGNESSLANLFNTITYSIEKKSIDSIGTFSPNNQLSQRLDYNIVNDYNSKIASIGEYMDPANTFKYVGYMMNETYRFYGAVEYLDGTLSDAYYLFDAIICRDADVPGVFDPKRNASSTFTDYKLNTYPSASGGFGGNCTLNGAQTLIPYVNVTIPPTLPAINGLNAKKVIKKIHIFRADVKEKTILANGLGVLGIKGSPAWISTKLFGLPVSDPNYISNRVDSYRMTTAFDPNNPSNIGTNGTRYSTYPFIADFISEENFAHSVLLLGGYTLSTSPNLNVQAVSNRKTVEFFSQDHLLSNERIEYSNIDKVINYGPYDNYYHKEGPITTTTTSTLSYGYSDDSSYKNWHGFGSFYFCGKYGSSTYQSTTLDTSKLCGPAPWIDEGGHVKVDNTTYGYYGKLSVVNWYSNSSFFYQTNTTNKGHVFFTSNDISGAGLYTGRVTQYGTHLISYYRPLTPDQQYGNNNIATIIPTGAYYDLQNDSTQLGTLATLNEINVFGGDTYTCKSLLRYRYTAPGNTSGGFSDGGRYGVGIEFYSQSRVNPQLRYNTEKDPLTRNNKVWPFDFNSPQDGSKFQEWFNHTSPLTSNYIGETVSYNGSFSDKNTINSLAIYDPNLYYENKQPATIYYSEPKLQESLIDSYSYIGPSNRKDLDISFGDINHHEIYNGQLITFQERSMNRQFFNSTTMISNPDTQIVLGDGGQVLSRRGETLSTYGLKNKWSVIKGRSKGGNDVLYWYDATTRKIMRFAYDGVVPISVRANVDSFIWNNTGYIQMYDTPAHGEGVCGVWNEKYNEALFTFRAKKYGIEEYSDEILYSEGDVVFYNVYGYGDFHETGEFYIRNNVPFAFTGPPTYPYPDSPYWDIIPHNNNSYYNEFTIVFSEDKNGFTTFYSPKPKIYMTFKDGYLTPYPISDYGQYIYENDRGNQLIWYDQGLMEDAYIEGVINYNPELIKTAEAISIDSNTTPYKVEIRSAQHNTFMTSANNDFASVEGMYRSPVKNDTTPDGDTSRVYGRWFGVKYIMQSKFQAARESIRSFVLKVRARNRMYNK